MTTPVPGEWQEDQYESGLIPQEEAWEEETGTRYDPEPGVPVRLIESPERNAPEFTGWLTVTIQQAGTITASPYCVQLLNRRYRRFKAKFGQLVFPAGTTAVIFSNKPDPLTLAVPMGFTVVNPSGAAAAIQNPGLPDYDGEQALYAVAIGGIATLSLFDEQYGEKKVRDAE
jgi:hypothetical protein